VDQVRFSVTIANPGTYRIFVRTIATSGDEDSFWVQVDDGDWIEWNKVNYPYTATGWIWDQVGEWTGGDEATPLTFELAAGAHTVTFAHREPNTPLDKVLIALATDEVPTGLGGTAQNCGTCTAGAPCNDGDPCTVNDVLDADCNCAGVVADSDNDGVCDAEDQCPGSDDTQDADGDGTPDGCDDCDGSLVGTACDDGDPNTQNDQYNAVCECVGEPVVVTDEYWLEAECATYGNQWEPLTAADASGQVYLQNQENNSFTGSAPADPAYHIQFSVEIATAGTYRIFARTIVTNGGEDSFWVQVNDGDWIKWNKINFPYSETDWVWDQVGEWTGGNNVTPLTFALAAGSNTVVFAHREPGTKLDKLLITLEPGTPTGIGGLAENCGPCGGVPCASDNAKAAADRAQRLPGQPGSTAVNLGRLYPNPVLEQATLGDLETPVRDLELFDTQGRLQRRFPDQEGLTRSLDLSDLPKGVYVLRGKVGAQIGIWRVIVQ
jgi:hypothetical protein